MITDYGFVLARGDKGFRHFLKFTLFEVEKCISNFESKGISRTLERPNNYVIVKRIKSLYTEYIDGLSNDEKDGTYVDFNNSVNHRQRHLFVNMKFTEAYDEFLSQLYYGYGSPFSVSAFQTLFFLPSASYNKINRGN